MGERRKILEKCDGSTACRAHVMVSDYEFKVKLVQVNCIVVWSRHKLRLVVLFGQEGPTEGAS